MPAKDYNNYMNEYLKKRYARRRQEAIDQLGGQCVDCGTKNELEFDHEIASTKTYAIAKLFTSASNALLQSELAKCVLRCTDCHKAKTKACGDRRPVL